MTDGEFLSAFEARTLTRPEWTHAAHVRMAWLYLTRHPFAEALERVRCGIQQLNAAFHQAEAVSADPGQPEGYHDTITVAFVRVIAARLRQDDDFPAFCDRNPDLLDRTLPALLQHYTRERLYSLGARLGFIEPDREGLPDQG